MSSETELLELKRRLTAPLMAIPAVSGLGIRDAALTVYLEEDSPAARQAVSEVMRQKAPGARFGYAVTGTLRAQ